VSSGVFATILGIPAHPLLIHAAVVFIPLLILGVIVYLAVPNLRARITWAVFSLAIIGPVSGLAAKLSGDAFRARLVDRMLASPEILAKVDEHRHFGTMTAILAGALGVLTLLILLVPALRKGALGWVIGAVTVVVAAATGYYCFKTGDTGAHIVWSGF
jgi:hypothetical protein